MGNSAASAGYSCEMQALVSQWRQLWSASAGTTDPSAPFGIVTLASSGSEGANSLAMGAMRQAQTAGFGVLPPPSSSSGHAGGMANTFLAQAYDLDDKWSGDRGPVKAQIPLASQFVLRALLMPSATPGSLYRCGKST